MPFSEPIRETDLSGGVCIVAPSGDGYQAAARDIQTALEKAGCSDVDVLLDTTPHEDIAGRHAIALGNMMGSALLKALYFRAYDLTDRAWPGPGGWVVRTAPHSLEDLGHVIVVGVSQEADVSEAAGKLAAAIEANGSVLPLQYRVQLGRWKDLYLEPAREMLDKRDRDLEQDNIGGGSGDWTYMMVVSRIGMLAVQTGLAELMEMFCREVCHFAQRRFHDRQLTSPMLIHGFVRTLLMPFAIIENHPGIPRELREETLETFLALHRSREGAGNSGFLSCVGIDQVRQNHQTRTGLDLFYGGRYFHQVHGLPEGLAWMKLAEVFFAPQMASNKPVCDSWGHQWSATLFNTADYALGAAKMDYFSSSPYLEGADRALVAHSCVDRPPESYLLMAAAVTGNDEYLLFCNASDEDSLVERSVRNAEEPLRTWVTGRHAAVPHRLGRVGVAPLSRLFYGSVESYRSFTPSNGVYRQSVPYEQTFDKVYFRSGWTEDDDYLLLDGISGGSHSYQDGNCIVRFTSRGISWFQGPGGNAPATVRDYVGLSLAVDGCGPGCEERYAALRYFLEGDALAVAGTAMAYPQRGDWYRHIVWCRAGWFLVVDEVWSHIEGEFLVEGRWHLLGDVSPVEGGLRSVQADARLEMRHVGSGQQDLVASDHACTEDYTSWIQRTVARLTPGTGVRFATLFWADSTDHRREFRLLPENSGYRVEGGTDPVRIALSDKSEAPEISATGATLPTADGVCDGSDPAPFHIRGNGKTAVWRTACAGSVTTLAVQGTTGVAGDDRGGIVSFDRAGNVLWNQEIEGGVRAAAALEDGWVVGGDDETVHRLDASGDVVWSRRIEWQPMNWDSWTQKNCRVLSLAAGDIDGDGRVEILAGCADRHLYAFDDGGDLLWRSPCEWGPPVCLATARLGEGPELQTLAGLADPAIHGHTLVFGADGSLEKTLSRPDITCWGIPSWSRSLCVADVDGDGWDEVVSGVDTNHNQLIVYRRDGEVLWDADLGGAVLAVAVRDARVYAGASNGFVQCFGAEGGRLWSRFLVEPVMGLGPREAGGCRVALSGGSVIELGVEGTVTGSSEASAKTTAAAWVPQWGDGVLLVGGEDGVVRCFG